MFGIQFYPTPEPLQEKMMSKIDFSKVKYILEPSAGRGDLCNAAYKSVREWYKKTHKAELQHNKLLVIDCIEIDRDLAEILKCKGYNVVANDFLTFNTYSSYDLIVMNPPFADGDKHLLKAIEMSENGGQICCILNAETLLNPFSVYRKDLLQKLDKYKADIEYVSGAFKNAERKTGVDIAIVYINIPTVQYSMDLFNNLIAGEEFEKTYEGFNNTQLALNDTIEMVLKQYNDECRLGLTIIDTYEKIQHLIPKSEGIIGANCELVSLSVYSSEPLEVHNTLDSNFSMKNKFIRELRYKYWNILFQTKELSNLFTETVRKKLSLKMQDLRSYDFTYSNIKTLQIELSKNMNKNIEQAILEKFEELTYKNSMDCSKNIHYYSGWKTNDAYAINKKVIIPMYGIYENYFGWQLYKTRDFLEELEKIFTYLDAGRTEGDNVYTVLYSESYKIAHNYNGERLKFKYFECEFKKKGTIHLWFSNLELLKKFNIFGANKKGWLPDSYGKKKYKDMTTEEQAVVNSFEGKQSYEETVNNSQFYLAPIDCSNSMLMLEEK